MVGSKRRMDAQIDGFGMDEPRVVETYYLSQYVPFIDELF